MTIFLDIDGVLNNEEYYTEYYEMGGSPDKIEDLDPFCVLFVNHLIDKFDVDIVISSTWRFLPHRMELLNKRLKKISGITDNLRARDYILRGNEIFKYCKDHNIGDNDYLILDDDSDMLYWQKDNFIKVGRCRGLRDTALQEQISKFVEQHAEIKD